MRRTINAAVFLAALAACGQLVADEFGGGSWGGGGGDSWSSGGGGGFDSFDSFDSSSSFDYHTPSYDAHRSFSYEPAPIRVYTSRDGSAQVESVGDSPAVSSGRARSLRERDIYERRRQRAALRTPIIMFFVGGLFVGICVFRVVQKDTQANLRAMLDDPPTWAPRIPVRVHHLSVALSGATEEVRGGLVAAKQRAASGSDAHLVRACGDICRLLRAHSASAELAFLGVHEHESVSSAQGQFSRLQSAERNRTQNAEGEGDFIVVTLLLAVRDKTSRPGAVDTRDGFDRALVSLTRKAREGFLALDVHWQPDADDGPLDRETVLLRFPHLSEIEGAE